MAVDAKTRFMNMVDTSSGCWGWLGARDVNGYGRFRDGKVVHSHHFSFCAFKGLSIGKNQVIMHLCDNPDCVNPEHLSLGTQSDNMKDRYNKKRGRLCRVGRIQKIICNIIPQISDDQLARISAILNEIQ